ncbi:phage minor head protein [Nocardia nova]|uniref:phage minor head protein n=1 Tax=Nocardia nova TaxID=37330 RepID=UPI0018936F23|nr:phage minor head protein [Nocardia nova]MBF6277058.1 hypothetical protein [Nocardia nova]
MSSERRAALLDVLTLEHEIEALAATALRAWLKAATDAALPVYTASAVIPPDPNAIARTAAAWEQQLDNGFLPKLGAIVDRLLGDDRERLAEWKSRTLASVRSGLLGIPGRAAKKVEASLRETAGQALDKARRAAAKALSFADSWRGDAAEIGRNSGVALYNAAKLARAELEERSTGKALDKMWLSLHDDRTRTSHRHADRQRVPLAADFVVGGFSLRFPGDRLGPPEEVIGCRCVVVILDSPDNSLENDAIAASTAPMEGKPMAGRTFEAMLMPAGIVGRSGMSMLSPAAQLLDTKLPLALKWQPKDDPGHDGSVTVGAIESLELRDGGLWGTGTMLDGPDTEQAIQQIEAGVTAPSAELVVRSETLTDTAGSPVTPDTADQMWMDGAQVVMRMDAVEIVGASLVSVPEFRETTITLGDVVDNAPALALVAAAVESAARIVEPDIYPASYFEDPQLTGPTPIDVDEGGRVFGHLALFNSSHRAFPNIKRAPYRSHSGYADFHQSSARLDNGEKMRVGRLTVGGGHGPCGSGPRPALAHYDDVSTCWALVRAGEDQFGIWVAGAIHAQADEAMVKLALGTPHSGHWEPIGGYPELIAAHAVNSPGYAIYTSSQDEDGNLAMVASFGPRPAHPAADTAILDAVAQRAVELYAERQAAEQRRVAARKLVAASAPRRRTLADVIRESHARNVRKVS